ncbi:MAG: hypothetical protein S0880_04185 [Actinomycetota bacterium]|nr:hypothetical protein [Actinomycetota bacterium]
MNLGRPERILLGALGCSGTIGGSLVVLWSRLPTILRVAGGSTAAVGVFLIGLATIWGSERSPIARDAASGSEPTPRPKRPRERRRAEGRRELPAGGRATRHGAGHHRPS